MQAGEGYLSLAADPWPPRPPKRLPFMWPRGTLQVPFPECRSFQEEKGSTALGPMPGVWGCWIQEWSGALCGARPPGPPSQLCRFPAGWPWASEFPSLSCISPPCALPSSSPHSQRIFIEGSSSAGHWPEQHSSLTSSPLVRCNTGVDGREGSGML